MQPLAPAEAEFFVPRCNENSALKLSRFFSNNLKRMKEGGGDGRRRGYFVLMLRLIANGHTA